MSDAIEKEVHRLRAEVARLKSLSSSSRLFMVWWDEQDTPELYTATELLDKFSDIKADIDENDWRQVDDEYGAEYWSLGEILADATIEDGVFINENMHLRRVR